MKARVAADGTLWRVHAPTFPGGLSPLFPSRAQAESVANALNLAYHAGREDIKRKVLVVFESVKNVGN